MKPHKWVDLHTHTTASDGDISPSRLVDKALERNLGAVAITDHDTMDGVEEGLVRGKQTGVWVIPGVELSVAASKGKTCHLLGYFPDRNHDEFAEALQRLQNAREDRNNRILERLAELDVHLLDEHIPKERENGVIGRPHFARALVMGGYASSVHDAFKRFLRRGAAAYVDRFRLDVKEAVGLLKRAGGVSVLAHPITLGFHNPLELEAFVADLVDGAGLQGIEVLNPDHDMESISHFRYLADKYKLVKTGGTDYHGYVRHEKTRDLGSGDLRVPFAWAEELKELADKS